MSLYFEVDKHYYVSQLSNLKAVIDACDGYTNSKGLKITKSIARDEIKKGGLKLYRFSDDDLKQLREQDYVRDIDWTFTIKKSKFHHYKINKFLKYLKSLF